MTSVVAPCLLALLLPPLLLLLLASSNNDKVCVVYTPCGSSRSCHARHTPASPLYDNVVVQAWVSRHPRRAFARAPLLFGLFSTAPPLLPLSARDRLPTSAGAP